METGNIAGPLTLLLMAFLAISAGQASDDPEELSGERVNISDIQANSTAYNGTMVVVEGAIELECGSGCWFVLNDGTGSIYVDILPNNFVIPQKSGKDAKVFGEVTVNSGEPQIIGKMVKIGGEVYQ